MANSVIEKRKNLFNEFGYSLGSPIDLSSLDTNAPTSVPYFADVSYTGGTSSGLPTGNRATIIGWYNATKSYAFQLGITFDGVYYRSRSGSSTWSGWIDIGERNYTNLSVADGVSQNKFVGQYTRNGRNVTFGANISITSAVSSGHQLIKGLPNSAEGNVSFLAMRNSAFGTFYSLRLSGNHLYTNMDFPAGEYAICGSYIAASV